MWHEHEKDQCDNVCTCQKGRQLARPWLQEDFRRSIWYSLLHSIKDYQVNPRLKLRNLTRSEDPGIFLAAGTGSIISQSESGTLKNQKDPQPWLWKDFEILTFLKNLTRCTNLDPCSTLEKMRILALLVPLTENIDTGDSYYGS